MSVLIEALARADRIGPGYRLRPNRGLLGGQPFLILGLLLPAFGGALASLATPNSSRFEPPATVVSLPLPGLSPAPIQAAPEAAITPPEILPETPRFLPPLPAQIEVAARPRHRVPDPPVAREVAHAAPPARPPASAVKPAPSRPVPQPAELPPPAPTPQPEADWRPKVDFTGGSALAAARSVPTVTGEGLVNLRKVFPDGGMHIAIRLHRENLARANRPPAPLFPPGPQEERDLRAVLALLERAELAAPNAPQIEAQIALVQAALSDLSAAIGNMRRAAERQPSNPAFRAMLAILLDRAGRTADAVPAYLEAQRLVLEDEGWRVPLPATPTEMRRRVETLAPARR